MAFTAEDRTAITELIAMHGHLVDAGALDRLDEVFTDDVLYDVTDLGAPPIHGLAAMRDAAYALGDGNPVAHLVTNTVLTETGDQEATALSKGLGVRTDGTCGSVTYEDTLLRTASGWRITHRRVLAHRTPLGS